MMKVEAGVMALCVNAKSKANHLFFLFMKICLRFVENRGKIFSFPLTLFGLIWIIIPE